MRQERTLGSIRIPDLLVGLKFLERIWIERKVSALCHGLQMQEAGCLENAPHPALGPLQPFLNGE